MWEHTGEQRPDFAEPPQPGQESVWDYPRPPVLVTNTSLVQVLHGEEVVAQSSSTQRVLETASPPTYYFHSDDIQWGMLTAVDDKSYCEWKGTATYWALATDVTRQPIAWQYQDPSPRFSNIAGCISFYPGRIACFVDAERVQPQPGEFYGGWVTSKIAGPFKGEPGTGHW
ncbi:MAG: DUF427 domain-containing protein [Halioglobus sp.]